MRGTSPASLLTVGILLQYMIPAEERDVQCAATLVGWKEGSFVLSTLPYVEGRPLESTEGTPCVVRYLHDGKVVGYRSEIRACQMYPEPLLFLSYPDRIDEILLRKHPRIHVQQPVTVLPLQEARPGQGMFRPMPVVGLLKDLSVTGCRIVIPATETSLGAGTVVQLEFELPGIGHVANLAGMVRNAAATRQGLIVGVEFQFYKTEFIEFRGWGGSVQKAIEQFVTQRCVPVQACEA